MDERVGQTLAARAGLYRRLVREAWGELDEPVRRLHARALSSGTFKVCRGRGRLARLLARLLGLPREGEAVPLLLKVTPHGDGGERWHRDFAGRDFVTEQREHAGSLLAERTGPFELLFGLTVEGGALAYRSVGAALRAGRLRVNLPRGLAPRVEALERADGRGVRVSVRVTAPLVGLLIEYVGHVMTEGDGEG
ncbi:MAG: DUF4166 domain-containing protein [Acidobacteria bacterium]|nr:DUF4166 domain-containing protein [Acidobacteriota bacterium]